jgi:hypothetical protein
MHFTRTSYTTGNAVTEIMQHICLFKNSTFALYRLKCSHQRGQRHKGKHGAQEINKTTEKNSSRKEFIQQRQKVND